MDQSAGWLLGIGLLGLFVVLVRHGWKTRGERRAMIADAKTRGWTYVSGPGPAACRIEGLVDGVAFRATRRRAAGRLGDAPGGPRQVTEVTVPAPAVEGRVIVLPALPPMAGLAAGLTGGLFHRILLGEDAARAEALREAPHILADPLAQTHHVLASTDALAREVLVPRTIDALAKEVARIGASHPVVLIRDQATVTLRLLDAVSTTRDIEMLARLAVTAARPA